VTTKKTRRPYATGTIEKVGEHYRFRCPDGTGERYTSPAEHDSYDAAEKALEIHVAKMLAGELVAAKGITLRQYVDHSWLPRMEKNRPRSVKTYRSNWNGQIAKAPFVDRPLRLIKRRDVRAWVDRMKINHPEHPVSVLRTIFAAAIDDELVEVNPAAALRLERKKREDTSPTPEEQKALLECGAIPWPVRAIIATALGTGMRPGEWRHLKVADVKLDATPPRLIVRRGSDKADTTKDGKVRTAPLFGLALEVLTAWLEDLPTYAPRNPRGLVFPQANGRVRRQTHPLGTFDGEDAWVVYLRAAKVRDTIRLHDLRHAAATGLLSGLYGRAWSTEEVQRLLGHSSSATTEKFYLHAGERMVLNAAVETVRNSPTANHDPAQITGRREVSQLSPSSSSDSPESRPVLVLAPSVTADWTASGLLTELREALRRLHAGKASQDELARLVRRVIDARRGADPLERALVRMGTAHWRAAFVEVIEAVVPDATSSRRKGRKGGAR
jgi:integrase